MTKAPANHRSFCFGPIHCFIIQRRIQIDVTIAGSPNHKEARSQRRVIEGRIVVVESGTSQRNHRVLLEPTCLWAQAGLSLLHDFMP
jgi:hypothetical protein